MVASRRGRSGGNPASPGSSAGEWQLCFSAQHGACGGGAWSQSWAAAAPRGGTAQRARLKEERKSNNLLLKPQ